MRKNERVDTVAINSLFKVVTGKSTVSAATSASAVCPCGSNEVAISGGCVMTYSGSLIANCPSTSGGVCINQLSAGTGLATAGSVAWNCSYNGGTASTSYVSCTAICLQSSSAMQ